MLERLPPPLVVLGAVPRCGWVVVDEVLVLVGLVPLPDAGLVKSDDSVVSETYSVVPEPPVRLTFVPEPDPDPEEEDPPLGDTDVAVPFSISVNWSWAAVRLDSAWSSDSCAEVGSSVASS